MTQFLPAPSPDHPMNFWERLFTVSVLFMGFLVFTSTLGSVTALITQSKKVNFERMKGSTMLRRFFVENKVSHDLASRVTHALTQQQSRMQAFIVETDIPSLSSLPKLLRMDIRYEMHSVAMDTNPCLQMVHEASSTCIRDICHEAIVEKSLQRSDVPFHYFDKCVCMRFLKHGALWFYPMLEDEVEDFGVPIEKDDFLSEPCLWVGWVHQGFCIASETSRVIELKTEAFSQVVLKHPKALWRCVNMAEMYCQRTTDRIADG